MTDNTGTEAGETELHGPPQFQVRTQYLKDFSFESPNAPMSLGRDETPQIQVAVDVTAQPLGGDDYEVELRITADAARGEEKVFVVEALYAGVFSLAGVPQELLEPMCLIECARFLYPFARQIIANATSQGSFPPLLLEPIDFMQLYQNSRGDAASEPVH